MDLAEVGRIAKALDRVKESSAGGSLRWTLDGRLVARQHDADSLVIRIGYEEREQLLREHPDLFFVPPRFDAHQKVVLRLPDANHAVVQRALQAAYDLQRNAD
ncbi:hypothetical protein [Kribbella sp. NPDC048928]|uniref:hypothetical protein n=1 Tax=Kribbella sp. NPDC048928 TaxID=3364111 RepID=UPI00371B7081